MGQLEMGEGRVFLLVSANTIIKSSQHVIGGGGGHMMTMQSDGCTSSPENLNFRKNEKINEEVKNQCRFQFETG